jgi:hypothetical protein
MIAAMHTDNYIDRRRTHRFIVPLNYSFSVPVSQTTQQHKRLKARGRGTRYYSDDSKKAVSTHILSTIITGLVVAA